MTQDIPPSSPPPDGPPAGMLASVSLTTEGPEQQNAAVEPPPDVPHPASSVDPNYREPLTPEQHRVSLLALSSQDALRAYGEILVHRIEELETALRPMANLSVQVANAKICLMAEGRNEEPAGGIWVSGVQNIHISPNEAIYYNAADIYGRGRVEQNMVRAFERVKLATQAQADRSVYIENGGKLQ